LSPDVSRVERRIEWVKGSSWNGARQIAVLDKNKPIHQRNNPHAYGQKRSMAN
jgi:hypothetical protein